MTANAQGTQATVVARAETRAKAQGLVAEIVWRERYRDRAEPRSFVLFQDARNAAVAAVSSAPSQAGPFLGGASAALTNEGDLIPYVTGTWDTSSTATQSTPGDLSLRVLRTGSLYDSAEWGWSYADDASDQWRGADDLRWQHDPGAPFGGTAGLGSHHAIVHSRAFNRIVVGYAPDAGSALKFRYRSAAAQSADTWSADFNILLAAYRSPNGGGYSSMWELPDGALRWAYTYEPDSTGAPGYVDIDIFGSTNGGASWQLLKEGVVTDLFGSTQVLAKLRIVSSGDWMRLEAWHSIGPVPQGLISAYSADRGASWAFVTGHNVADGDDDTAGNADISGKFEVWDLCSVDDSGTFLRVRAVSASGELRYELATRDAGWDQIANTNGASFESDDTDAMTVHCASGGGRCFALVFRSDHHGAAAGADYWSAASFIIPVDRIQAGWDSAANPRIADWARWGADDWTGLGGVARMHPKDATLAWVGDRLALFGSSVDRQTGTTTAERQTPSITYFGGSSRQPLRSAQITNFDMTTQLLTSSWHACLGSVHTGGAETSAFNPWGTSSGGTPTNSWTVERQSIQLTTSDTQRHTQSSSLASLTTARIADDGCFGFSTRAQSGSVPDTPYPPSMTGADLRSPRWGAVVNSESLITAGLTVSIAVHINGNTGQFAVYDTLAVSTLYESPVGALAGITAGTFYDFRIGLAHSRNVGLAGGTFIAAYVSAAAAGDYAWVSTGMVTTASAALPFANEMVGFGHWTVPLSTSTMEWREAFYSRASGLSQPGFSNPSTLRGWDCSPHVVRVGAAHDVLWGGAGGFKADTYTAPIRHEYGIGQSFGDSPQSHWRSTATTTQQIVLDSTLIDGDTHARFVHSGIAGISTNSRILDVEYADDSAFTAPARMRVDGLRYSLATVSTAEPGHVEIGSPSWQDGELAGHYLRARPGAVANPGILRIVGNAGTWLHVTGMTAGGTLATYGITAGATLDIWGSAHLFAYDDWPAGVRVITGAGVVDGAFPRYMRVTIPGADSQGEPPEGRWQLGRLQAGLTLPITVPLAWSSLRDSESGTVDLQTLGSGARVAYRAGAPRQRLRGTAAGDVDSWRVAFRSMIRLLGGYSLRPVVVCTDDTAQSLRAMYARFIGSTDMANAGYRYVASTGRWDRVGDLAVHFEQEI